MTQYINIAFAFDRNYYHQAVVAISSLLNCAVDKKAAYHIYCLIQNDVNEKIQKEERKENYKKAEKKIKIFVYFIMSKIAFGKMKNKYENKLKKLQKKSC